MKNVSVCLLLNNDYWGTIYSFERSGFAIVEKKGEFIIKDAPKEYVKVINNVQVELLVAYTKDTDARLIEYFKPLATIMVGVESVKNGVVGINDAKAYNALFRLAQQEYVCVLKPYVFLQQYWLTELIHSYETIDNSGVIGICHNLNETTYAPFSSKELESFTNVFLPNENVINSNGVLFFLREYLYLVGALDETTFFVGGMAFTQLQKRYFALGYNNYYVPTQSCLIAKEHKQTDHLAYEASLNNVNSTLYDMKKAKTYYLPL